MPIPESAVVEVGTLQMRPLILVNYPASSPAKARSCWAIVAAAAAADSVVVVECSKSHLSLLRYSMSAGHPLKGQTAVAACRLWEPWSVPLPVAQARLCELLHWARV